MPEGSVEYLGPLLRTLAETLDVRQVFERISSEARLILQHDFLMLGLLTEDRQRVRVIALSGELPEMPATTVFPPELRHVMERDAFVLNDMRAQAADGLARGWLQVEGRPQPGPDTRPAPLAAREARPRNLEAAAVALAGVPERFQEFLVRSVGEPGVLS